MSQPAPDRTLPADDAARLLARTMLERSGHASLAFIDAETGTPGISRIALGLAPDGQPMTLVSALAPHDAGLRRAPDCALMVGDVGPKGDPLSHPRLMIRARAIFVAPDDPARLALRAHWLKQHPKSTLYIDFADFSLVRLAPVSALLNAGFGRAYRLGAADLGA